MAAPPKEGWFIMLINVRSGIADAPLPDVVGFAVDIADHIESSTGTTIAVWQSLYGRPLGTIAWSVIVDSYAELANLNQKLAEDSTFHEKSAAAQQMFISGSFEDRLTNIVHTAGTAGATNYVSALTATGVAGKVPEVMAWGVEMADYVSNATGNSVSFCNDLFSTIGEVSWFASYPDAESIDAAQALLATDAGYLERISTVGELFLPGSGKMILSQRLN